MKQLFEEIPFTSHAIGDKMHVYNRIKRGKNFSNCLIPSREILYPQEVTDLLKKHSNVIIKPLSGKQGIDVIHIQKDSGQYRVVRNDREQLISKEDVHSLVTDVTKEHTFLVQPFIQSQTQNGSAYDFRLHTQKDGAPA
ncbi:YheC/YheD family protein [Shouchella shacheensis]|uniref:YheC/YheD family protein n=1 Tax=Shouchella shacheensis TaxID=1649580 RepID=UPI00073FB3B3|nr:YheC/YheD family protein [Shouchella shacheensis]